MPAQTVLKIRRGTAAQWTSAAPVLAAGEMGYETDTRKLKVGDGTTAWASLDYTIDGLAADITAASLGALTSETTTTLTADSVNTKLVFTDETGTANDVDLSWTIDDTNLARITNGTLNAETGIATFERDDATTFDVDFSSLLDTKFTLAVGADDSSLRNISTGESIKFIGGTKTSTTSDDEGNITITSDWVNADFVSAAEAGVTAFQNNVSFDAGLVGDLTGSVFADDSSVVIDGLTGNLFGDLTGDVTGNITGNVIGNLTGDVTGNVTGDIVGSVFSDDSTLLVDAVNGTLQLHTLTQEGATDGQALLWNTANNRWQPGLNGSDVYLVDGGRSDSIYTNGDLILDGGDST